jgi:AcrR family transcriptional regulator
MSRPRQITDEQILTAARECFLEHGPQAPTSVIAERLGVSQAALFKRFGSKETLLFHALVPRKEPPWVSVCELGPDERPIDEQLIEISLTVAGFFEGFVPCMAVLRAASATPRLDEMMEQEKPPPVRGTDALVAFVKRAQRQGLLREQVDARVFVSALLGSLLHRAFLSYVGAGHIEMPSSEEHVRGVVPLLLHGASDEEVAS